MYSDAKIGGVGIWLAEIVPCLKNTETGEIKETVVFRIESRSFLKKSTKRTGGIVHGYALNKELLNHYIDDLGATYLGAMHPYQFAFNRIASQKLLEVYTYEWN